MTSELISYLQKIHEYQETDFRWCNLRKLVKRSIIGNKILDAGCGTGHLTLDLLQSDYDVTAIDNSEELVNFTRELILDSGYPPKVFSCDLLSIKNYNFPLFDSIICLDVIEHIEKDDAVLKNLHDILQQDGALILSVPAIKQIYGYRDKNVGHYRRYSKQELRQKIEDAGFSIVSIRYWNFISIFPVVFFEKILHKPVKETVRHSKKSVGSKFLQPVLCLWFSWIENNFHFPFGLTLIVICRKK